MSASFFWKVVGTARAKQERHAVGQRYLRHLAQERNGKVDGHDDLCCPHRVVGTIRLEPRKNEPAGKSGGDSIRHEDVRVEKGDRSAKEKTPSLREAECGLPDLSKINQVRTQC